MIGLDDSSNFIESLKPGGPPLDVDPIFAYLDGVADGDVTQMVEANVRTWATWHRGFLQCLLFEDRDTDGQAGRHNDPEAR